MNGDCILWTGAVDRDGYGRTTDPWNNKNTSAHRAQYQQTYRVCLLSSASIDHLCRNRRCINPDHLELVTKGENTIRSTAHEVAARKRKSRSHCKHGHPYSEENTRFDRNNYRICKTCERNWKSK